MNDVWCAILLLTGAALGLLSVLLGLVGYILESRKEAQASRIINSEDCDD